MPRRKKRHKRKRRFRGAPHDTARNDPGRRERQRWQSEARNLIARTGDDAKLRRLLISIAEFLEPGRCERLGAEGVWGVFSAFREIAARDDPPTTTTFAVFFAPPRGHHTRRHRP